jgi:hypothetical protein
VRVFNGHGAPRIERAAGVRLQALQGRAVGLGVGLAALRLISAHDDREQRPQPRPRQHIVNFAGVGPAGNGHRHRLRCGADEVGGTRIEHFPGGGQRVVGRALFVDERGHVGPGRHGQAAVCHHLPEHPAIVEAKI